MLGKGAIMVVFGFILAFSMYQVRMSSDVLATTDNFNTEYVEATIHETAITAMNLAINKIWQISGAITADSFLVRANHCSSNVRITPEMGDTIKISVNTWGYIFDPDSQVVARRQNQMTAFFTKGNGGSIADYFMFTDNSAGQFWATGCTLWGPCHTNSVWHTKGAPVFYGKITAKQGIDPDPAKPSNKAEYHDGWEIGMDITIPTDMSSIINAATVINAGAAINTKNLYNVRTDFDFRADGTVIRTVLGNPRDTLTLASLADADGGVAIYSTADVHVKGTLNGAVTIYTTTDIWIDDDMVYADNPMNNLYSDDILGLVAGNNIEIADNPANNDGEVHINASIVTVNGSFEAWHYSSRSKGDEYFLGSQAQHLSGSHGFANPGGSIIKGYEEHFRYDPRLEAGILYPPHFLNFPGKMSLASWWE